MVCSYGYTGCAFPSRALNDCEGHPFECTIPICATNNNGSGGDIIRYSRYDTDANARHWNYRVEILRAVRLVVIGRMIMMYKMLKIEYRNLHLRKLAPGWGGNCSISASFTHQRTTYTNLLSHAGFSRSNGANNDEGVIWSYHYEGGKMGLTTTTAMF